MKELLSMRFGIFQISNHNCHIGFTNKVWEKRFCGLRHVAIAKLTLQTNSLPHQTLVISLIWTEQAEEKQIIKI